MVVPIPQEFGLFSNFLEPLKKESATMYYIADCKQRNNYLPSNDTAFTEAHQD